ncbi:MAG TPA: hypothetical protein P5572_18260 [Phycisphaerae bacterium]|nr:hypothetical protein [Phycisphaerae bacterium]
MSGQVKFAGLLVVMLCLTDVTRGECPVELYVSSDFGHEVLRYDGTTGALADVFVPVSSNGPLTEPHSLIARTADVLVASFATDQVLRFDRTTGNYLGEFIGAASGLDAPVYMAYGPDGNLYIASQASDEILRYTPAGAFVDAFVPAGSGGLDGPSGFAFGSDDRLYVAGRYSANVLAYAAASGTFLEQVLGSADGLTSGDTFGLNVGASGDMYVASNNHVYRYSLASGTVVAAIPLGFPIGIEPGPAGGVFVASSNNLYVIDESDNTLSGAFLAGGAINVLNFFHFAPVLPQTPGDGDCDGDVDLADLALLTACLTGPAATSPAPLCRAAFDADADADIDLRDFATFAAQFE